MRQCSSSPSPTAGSTNGSNYFPRDDKSVELTVGEFDCRQGINELERQLLYSNIERWIRDTILLQVRMMPASLVACAPDTAFNPSIGCPARLGEGLRPLAHQSCHSTTKFQQNTHSLVSLLYLYTVHPGLLFRLARKRAATCKNSDIL